MTTIDDKTMEQLWNAGFRPVAATLPTSLMKIQGKRAMVYAFDHEDDGIQKFKRVYDGDKSYIEKILRGEIE